MLNVDGRYALVYAHVINSTFTDILFCRFKQEICKDARKKKVALLLLVIQISILYKTIECEI